MTTATEYQRDYGYSCVRCWHHHHYHAQGTCTAGHKTTAGFIPCDCQHFYHRNDAIRLIDQSLTTSDSPDYTPTTTAEADLAKD